MLRPTSLPKLLMSAMRSFPTPSSKRSSRSTRAPSFQFFVRPSSSSSAERKNSGASKATEEEEGLLGTTTTTTTTVTTMGKTSTTEPPASLSPLTTTNTVFLAPDNMEAGAAMPAEEEEGFCDTQEGTLESVQEQEAKGKWREWWEYLRTELIDLCERAEFIPEVFTWAYMLPYLCSLVYFLLSAYICACASVSAGWETEDIYIVKNGLFTPAKMLKDRGHQWVAKLLAWLGSELEYINAHHIPDTILAWVIPMTLVLIASSPKRFIILRRVQLHLGNLFLIRAALVHVNALPDASPVCQAQFYTSDGAYKQQEKTYAKVMYRAWKFCSNPGRHKTCGDMMFSGHTTLLVTCALIWWEYCREENFGTKVFFRKAHVSDFVYTVMRWYMILLAVVGAFLIVATRLHYTMDVVVAVFLCPAYFLFYHSWLAAPQDFGRFMTWMEGPEIEGLERRVAVRIAANRCLRFAQ